MTRSRSVFEGAITSSGDDLTVRPLILADAQLGELAELLDADPAVTQDLQIAHSQNAVCSVRVTLTSSPVA